ncbi:short-chain dehydrogenase [Halalkalibacillus sediminis]|uniref:Short-chain dehydrogenase n=1 Tax=Halalkalibacillus sediminis TaxID=2018042 RepID=A0A2I0QRJ0_9BACI|nr:SDR family oxidoreductase [Halalkalibacillus sediminis]PKR76957.1 short-chain dehydrogenase [Halalkalibacillus sediminis]
MKQALITGAGTGLGRALALEYTKDYDLTYLVGRRKQPLEETKQLIDEQGGKAEVVVCDITNRQEIEQLTQSVGFIELLINNAGIGHFGSFEDLSKDQIDDMIRLNVTATIDVTQSFIKKLLASQGKILNVISTAGLRGKVSETVYCASKFAQRGFTESLQAEYEGKLTVSGVYMGGMNTPFWDESDHVTDPSGLKLPEDVAKEIHQQDDGRKEIHI